ncbi:MAG: PEP/pyruvate-binding domain-containing protein [Armatimonadota bacterium]|nr:PEP/pyruvate-binding domain-containing protein [Armatimonadota bacterium]
MDDLGLIGLDVLSAREVVGGKGRSLQLLAGAGVPVPPACIVPIGYPASPEAAGRIAREALARLGAPVSVRSSGAVSMPGMMQTVLGLSLESEVAEAIERVWDSWDSEEARAYRRRWGISGKGTAVVIQRMVDGAKDERSGTGVAFSADQRGRLRLNGEWLPVARGDDLVSGRTQPRPLDELEPRVLAELGRYVRTAERLYRDAVDVEFTVEAGTLWVLQARPQRHTPDIAIRVIAALSRRRTITPREAAGRAAAVRGPIAPRLLAQGQAPIAQGVGASPGVCSGLVCTSPAALASARGLGQSTVYVVEHASPDLYAGYLAADAIVARTGGLTCHAAVAARELGRPCVVGVGRASLRGVVTVDGSTGRVYRGALPASAPDLSVFRTLRRWAGGWAASAAEFRDRLRGEDHGPEGGR